MPAATEQTSNAQEPKMEFTHSEQDTENNIREFAANDPRGSLCYSSQAVHVFDALRCQLAQQAAAIARLEGEREALKPLVAFARKVIDGFDFENDLSGAYIQEQGEAAGVFVRATYDPEVHGELMYCDPGDEIFVPAPRLAALSAAAQQQEEGK